MALTPDEILAHVRALPAREQLKLVERVLHEVAQDPELDEAAMDAELGRRILSARANGTVPAEEVITQLRARR